MKRKMSLKRIRYIFHSSFNKCIYRAYHIKWWREYKINIISALKDVPPSVENKIVYKIFRCYGIFVIFNYVQSAIEAMKRKCLTLWEFW